jgi:hypothetical protein
MPSFINSRELHSLLAAEVGESAAHRVIDKLSGKIDRIDAAAETDVPVNPGNAHRHYQIMHAARRLGVTSVPGDKIRLVDLDRQLAGKDIEGRLQLKCALSSIGALSN